MLQLIWCSGFALYDHVTDAFAVFHWLCLSQRVDYKVAVMAFRPLNGLSPPYLDQLVHVADLPGRHSLPSSALILITPAAGSGISSSYRRPTFVSSRCIHPLEQLAS